MEYEHFVKSKKACEILGLHPDTLRRMSKNMEIITIRTSGNHRLYNVKEYISRETYNTRENEIRNVQEPIKEKISICYCRVSSLSQKDDLERQIEYMSEMYPTYTIIKDIGSGLNFKRKGIKTILELAHQGSLQEVVVAYKDRLCRFGYELIEWIIWSQSQATIVVLNKKDSTPEQELTDDLLQVLHVFSARSYGFRKYNKNKTNQNLPNNVTTFHP
jgi:predicted site-specific integrase-resolvase